MAITLVILLALGVGSSGLATAVEHVSRNADASRTITATIPVQAAFEAHTRVDLNLRVGPDTSYGFEPGNDTFVPRVGAAQAADALSHALDNAPDQPQQGHPHRRPGFHYHYGGYAFGLACAAARPSTFDPATDTYVPRIGVRAGPCTLGDLTVQHGVTDSSGAAEVLAQAMDNTPDQAQQGLEQAWEAVTTVPAHEHAADRAPAGAPAQVTAPPVTAPPVTAPPATTPPVDTPPSVDTPAGPPSDVPGGRP